MTGGTEGEGLYGRHAAEAPQEWPEEWFAPRRPLDPAHKPLNPRKQHRRTSAATESRAEAPRRDEWPAVPSPRPEEEQSGAPQRELRKASAPKLPYFVATLAALVLIALVLNIAGDFGTRDEEAQEPATTIEQPQEQAPPIDDIPTSRPLAMRIPSVGLHADFEKVNCKNKGGMIDPSTLSEACVYTADDRPYSLPGTDAPDIVVVAGHAAAGVPAIFDKLYNPSTAQHTVHIGDALYVKTETSGDRWLKYEATDLHEPEKSALAGDKDIWGEGPTPGRLLTITCIQPPNPFEPSVRNAVIGWQFRGVVGADEAEA